MDAPGDFEDLKDTVRYMRMISSTYMCYLTNCDFRDGYYWANFMPSDTEERYNQNLASEEQRKKLFNNGWIDENGHVTTPIVYRINQHGFRCENFTDDPGIVFFGCSFTYGIGLVENQIWTNTVANHFRCKSWNLAHPGHGLSLQATYAASWLREDIRNIKAIAVLIPSGNRYEFPIKYDNDVGDSFFAYESLLGRLEPEKPSKTVKTLIDGIALQAHLDNIKNLYILESLAKELKVPFVAIPAYNMYRCNDADLARDLMHVGPKQHKKISAAFIEKLTPLLKDK